MPLKGRRLLVVSNYLPHLLKKKKGKYSFINHNSSLVNICEPMVKNSTGVWIGQPGCEYDAPIVTSYKKFNKDIGYTLIPIIPDSKELELFNNGFVSHFLKPILHNHDIKSNYEALLWDNYLDINKKYAHEIINSYKDDLYIWIHGCELMSCGYFLKENDFHNTTNYFLDTPFPPLETLSKLPNAEFICESLLAYDHIGFQTLTDKNNFISALRHYIEGLKIEVFNRQSLISYHNRSIKIGIYPMGINYDNIIEKLKKTDTKKEISILRKSNGDKIIILSLDNISDYEAVKNRLVTIKLFLKKYPEFNNRLLFKQIVKPEHVSSNQNQKHKKSLEKLAVLINDELGNHIEMSFTRLVRPKLMALLNASDIALFTPFKKGCCMIAKEYIAAQSDLNGVLILSQFTGAAEMLADITFIVNPYDIENTADTIYAALLLEDEEKSFMMKRLRDSLCNNSAEQWFEQFLEKDLVAKDAAVSLKEFSY